MDENSERDASEADLTRQVGDQLPAEVFDLQLATADVDQLVAEVPSQPRTFRDLRPPYRGLPPWVLNLRNAFGEPFDGSRLEEIGEHPDALALEISGLDQATFERLVAGYGAQFLSIELSKCPRIADLSPLEDLPDLRLVQIFWNQRATRLWDLSRNPGLTGLSFEDFSRLHDLNDVHQAASLEELVFGNKMWVRSEFASLEPLAALGRLRSLEFNAKRIEDGRVEPLGELTQLERLIFPFNQFTTRQVAWLRARIPASLESQSLDPMVTVKRSSAGDKDVLLIGKRKPFLDSVTHAARIAKHVDEFWRMVEDFQRDPTLKPD